MTQTYEPSAGTHINKACSEAVALAVNSASAIRFTFNGIALQALPTDKPQVLVDRWQSIQEAQQKAYRESPEGKRAQSDRAREIARRQQETDAHIAALPKILRPDDHLDALMAWLRGFVTNADVIGVSFDREGVAIALETAGYLENDLAGQSPEWFVTRERMGRYVVGQAISGLRTVGIPHPVSLKFIEDYFALEADR